MTRTVWRLLAALPLVVGILLAGVVGAATVVGGQAASAEASHPIVVVASGGLSWGDVSPTATPALWGMLRRGSSATLVVRSVHANTCPVDGWLTLSAGQRAGDAAGAVGAAGADGRPACRAVPGDIRAGETVRRWSAYATAAAATSYDATIGLLGSQVAGAGRCLQAVGPGAAIGAADEHGLVRRYVAFSADLTSALRACPASLVDVGAVRDPQDVDPGDEVRPTLSRTAQVATVDRRVAQVLRQAPVGADVVVASLADAGRTERLRMVVAQGPDFGPGTLRSSSTRRPGLVQLADLTATVLDRLGIPKPSSVGGAPLQPVQAGTSTAAAALNRLRARLDDDLASHEVHGLVTPFFFGWVGAQLGCYAVVLLAWRRRWSTRMTRLRLLRLVEVVAVLGASVPAATYLANLLPWWRASAPMLAVIGSVIVFAAPIAALALVGPWRRRLLGPFGMVCAVTVLVLSADVVTGSRLQLSSLMGLQPVVGGRFYGMGNVSFGVFATATLLLATAVADGLLALGRRRLAGAAVVLIGLAAVAVDALPTWGSDFGGPPALLPALALLALAVWRVRWTWRRGLLVVGGTVLFLVLLAVADWLRPASARSHLGSFVQAVLDGTAGDIVVRKLAQNVAFLLGSWLMPIIPVGLVLVVYVLARPTSRASRTLERAYRRAPTLRPGLVALVVMFLIGFALNDSGIAIPAVGGTLMLPLVLEVWVRCLERDVRAEAEGGPTRTMGDTAPRTPLGSAATSP